MTLYLTDNTPADEIRRAKASGFVHGVKLYPAGATTNSDSGVTDVRKPRAALEAMQAVGLPLLVHGEVTRSNVDVFDREAVFIDEVLHPLRKDFPQLKVVFEHITTREAAQYVRDASGPIAATITAHHLLYNRNAIFMTADGRAGVRPHYYCLPVLKREAHRLSLVEAATGGNPRFFLGTDSAPHPKGEKETACGCAGCYTALNALELYAEVVRRRGPARPARSLRQPLRRGLLRPAAQPRHADAAAPRVKGSDGAATRRGDRRAAARGRIAALESRRLIAFDASRPWMAAVAADLPLLAAADPRAALSRAATERGITTASGRPLEFVAADDAPPRTAYEAHIAASGRVPTRLNAHDLLNALAWLAFPRSKARLNELQSAAIARDGVGARRGGLRDAATLFDENGVVLATDDAWLVQCLRERRWRELFIDGRARWDGVRVLAFGHALMEKLASPYKAITAHVLVLTATGIDRQQRTRCRSGGLARRGLRHDGAAAVAGARHPALVGRERGPGVLRRRVRVPRRAGRVRRHAARVRVEGLDRPPGPLGDQPHRLLELSRCLAVRDAPRLPGAPVGQHDAVRGLPHDFTVPGLARLQRFDRTDVGVRIRATLQGPQRIPGERARGDLQVPVGQQQRRDDAGRRGQPALQPREWSRAEPIVMFPRGKNGAQPLGRERSRPPSAPHRQGHRPGEQGGRYQPQQQVWG